MLHVMGVISGVADLGMETRRSEFVEGDDPAPSQIRAAMT